ncbi:RING/U-box protein, partial [Trifolium medium]|nr:RING/U-box protein [Trifolium medium]
MRCGLQGAKLFFRSRVQLGVGKGSHGVYMYSEGSTCDLCLLFVVCDIVQEW